MGNPKKSSNKMLIPKYVQEIKIKAIIALETSKGIINKGEIVTLGIPEASLFIRTGAAKEIQ